jgi:hypothetical protein
MKMRHILAATLAAPALFMAGCALWPVSPTPITATPAPTAATTIATASPVVPPATFMAPPPPTPTPLPLVECIDLQTQTGVFCAGDSTCANWSGWTAGDPIPACMTTVVVCLSWPPPTGSEPCEGMVLPTPPNALYSPPGVPSLIAIPPVPTLAPLPSPTPTPSP